MINYLSIKNFALIEDVWLEFADGFHALTGETGSGKTIIVDALGLALGDKSAAAQVRKGASRLAVAAEFKISSRRLRNALKELDLLPGENEDEVLLLRREVDSSGRSRAFVNDRPVNVSTLTRLGELLVYAHGQHEHQLLLKPSEQLELLDTFGGLEGARASVEERYMQWRDLTSEQQAVALSDQERAQRIDLYKFQATELKSASLKSENEDEELDRILPQLKNAERLKNLAHEAHGLLYSFDESALDRVRKVQRDVEALQGLGADLTGAAEMIQDAAIKLEESAGIIDKFRGGLDLDPKRADEILSRMDLLGKLKRKYGPTLKDVLAYRAKVEGELNLLENAEERTRDLVEKLAEAQKQLKAAADKLSQGRAAAAKRLAGSVEKEFREVGLPRARFDVSVEKNEGAYSAHGVDRVQFQFSPNPGEGWQPLAAVASGGELSRVMLALKTVLAKADAVPVLVFDEIDAGVGGALGGALGKKLAKLGKTHQVVCITHLASIAACAHTHFAVRKDVKKDRTSTTVARLNEDDRVAEIARMFGGVADKSADKAVSVQHAKELLAEAKK